MYKIFYNNGSDDVLFLDDTLPFDKYKLSNNTLTLSVNASGSLTFDMTSLNLAYESLQRMKTIIKVYKNDRLYWTGRVVSEDIDFWQTKSVYCEGILSCLNDTCQPQHAYNDLPLRSYLEALLSVHNQKVDSSKQFEIGIVTVNNNDFIGKRVTNYETTWDLFKNIVDEYGGYLFVRYDNGHQYIDYRKECPRTSSQTIEFGQNLMNFTRKYDMSSLCTVLLPLGAVIESAETDDGFDKYTTVESVNSGSPYITNQTAVATYGWIEKQVTFDKITDPATLKTKAEEYLRDEQFDEMTLEVSAIDLQTMGVESDRIDILDEVWVKSSPHGLNKTFPVTELTIEIGEPANTSFVLNGKADRTLSGVMSANTDLIFAKMDTIPSRSAILESARNNATMLINNAVSGIFMLEYNEDGVNVGFRISNVEDWDSDGAKGWRFNIGGLGYFGNGFNRPVTLALTGEDGGIVANCITTGTMYADRIHGGTLTLGGYNNDNGILLVRNANGDSICRFDNTGGYINGIVYTENSSTGNWLRMEDGSLYGGNGSTQLAAIDTSAVIVDGDQGISYHGLQFSSDVVYFDCDFFAINGATGTTGYLNYVGDVSFSTTQIEVVTDAYIDGNGALQLTKATIEYVSGWSWYKTGAYFTNGIMCTGLENWSTGGADEHTSGVSTETGGTGGSHVYPPISPTGGYTNLEYIQTTNRQFFNTGYIPNANTKIECEYLLLGNYDEYIQALFGSPSMHVNYNSRGNHKIELKNGGQSVDSSKSFPWNQKIKVVLDNSQLSWYSGNTLIDSIAMSAGSSFGNYPLWVGCINNSGTVLNFGEFRIYSFKIYANNNLVMDFVPVKRNSDGVCGMLNTLTNAFYPDANGVGFLSSDFEDNYQTVNAVQTSGNLYVDTGFVHTANTKIVIDFIPSISGVSSFVHLWGAEANVGGNWTANDWWCYIENGALYVQRGRVESQPVSADLTQRMQITVEGLTAQFAFADGTIQTVQISGASPLSGLLTMWLFKVHYADNPRAGISQRFYSCQIYDNGVLVRDFIPVKRLSDNALMLYDRVAKEEYHPIGGTFTEVS